VYWFHYNAAGWSSAESSPLRSFHDFREGGKDSPSASRSLIGALNSPPRRHERLDRHLRHQTHLRALQGHRDMNDRGSAAMSPGAMSLHSAFAVRATKAMCGRWRGGDVSIRHPCCPRFRPSASRIDWVDGGLPRHLQPKSAAGRRLPFRSCVRPSTPTLRLIHLRSTILAFDW